MIKRALGNSDLQITPIGFGAWAIGGDWQFGWGQQDDNDSVKAIHAALELGVNWIDTAAVYGLGHSEEVVARAMRDWQGARPYIFTKCGMTWTEKGEIGYSLKRDSVRREVEASLRRLGVETIDLYQIHWSADDLAETEEGWQTMAELKTEGKIRWIGVSNFSVDEMKAAQKIAPVTSLQPPYSLVRPDAGRELLPYCRSQNIGAIVYSPMGSGLLTGAMTRERIKALPSVDWRGKNPEFLEPKLTENLALVERLRAVGARHHRPPGEVALAWVLRNPAVTGAIVGARNAAQVGSVMRAASLQLTNAEVAEIEKR